MTRHARRTRSDAPDQPNQPDRPDRPVPSRHTNVGHAAAAGRRRRGRLPQALAGLIAVGVAIAGCSAGSGGSGAPSGTPSPGESGAAADSVSIGLVAEPASLDFTTSDGAAIPQALLVNVYEGLVALDQDGQIVPALARSWTVSPDRRTYTFQLVEDATFTNGQPFTAEDAVFSINRVKTDWTISLKAGMDVVSSAEAISPTELQVTLTRPSNDWLYRMTTRIGAMFSRTGVDALATTPVGTGPYQLAEWRRGDAIVLERRDDYWGQAPHFATVTLRYFKDPTALTNALLSETIDVIGTVQAPESLAQFANDDRFRIIEGVTNGEVVLAFNNGKAPFTDVRVRQGIRHAIDHQALVDSCWAGRGTLIGSMVPPTDPWYEDLTGLYPYDPQRARELFTQAGVTGQTLRLRLPTLPYAISCGQVVASQLQQTGLEVRIDQLEFPAQWLTQVFTNADYDLSIIAHVEPRDMGAVFGDPAYYTRYGTPRFRQLLTAADSGSEQEQVTNLQAAARLLSEDAAADWLFLLPNLIVAERDITGLPRNAIGEAFDLTALGRS